jgi:hypothetical protein
MRAAGPPDRPARAIDTTAPADLTAPGPARSRALRAMRASLKRDVGLCGDRCAGAAQNALDAGLRAAQREP